MQNMDEIYKQYSQTVFKYIFCLTDNKELAEDITQETFVIAVQKINTFRGDCKLSVWLCQIAKYLWYKNLKKDKHLKFEDFKDFDNFNDSTDIEDSIIEKEDKLDFFKKLQNLDSVTKDVMYLRLMGNLSFNEIAEILGKTSNWARVTYYRGKQKLKEGLDYGKEE